MAGAVVANGRNDNAISALRPGATERTRTRHAYPRRIPIVRIPATFPAPRPASAFFADARENPTTNEANVERDLTRLTDGPRLRLRTARRLGRRGRSPRVMTTWSAAAAAATAGGENGNNGRIARTVSVGLLTAAAVVTIIDVYAERGNSLLLFVWEISKGEKKKYENKIPPFSLISCRPTAKWPIGVEIRRQSADRT